jgi:hypothetical protein
VIRRDHLVCQSDVGLAASSGTSHICVNLPVIDLLKRRVDIADEHLFDGVEKLFGARAALPHLKGHVVASGGP